ncbi:DUF3613 domain-containing protein [Pantoea sp. 18069]|uniref:DUF3613 domain-containing protein n=1 Tax=Pantoea sp. 18069 TaxID=2681415 RepID=UPI0013579D48|nr:DUF3613 domain-containing protein [Pantoea sp. 18069]
MMSHFASHTRRLCTPMAALLLGLAFASAAHAQVDPADRTVASVEVAQPSPIEAGSLAQPSPAVAQAAVQAPNAVQPLPLRVRRIDIGSATEALWDMQRASPGVHPRSIDGEQASRSYQRYLKSFETTIPEHYSTGLGVATK